MYQCQGVALEVVSLTDPGREPSKQVNEDTVRYAATRIGHLAVVCDGMGGHSGGREASTLAADTIMNQVELPVNATPGEILANAVRAANHAVFSFGAQAAPESRPGSTCVTMLLHGAGAEISHVGDSRAYLVRDSVIYRLTRDHSVVQSMVDAGMIAAADAANHPDANRITRALGMTPTVEVEAAPQPLALAVRDVFILTSDGLTDLLVDQEIQEIATTHLPYGLEVTGRRLIDLANARGGHDNITVQLLKVAALGQPVAALEQPVAALEQVAAPETALEPKPAGFGQTQPLVTKPLDAAEVDDGWTDDVAEPVNQPAAIAPGVVSAPDTLVDPTAAPTLMHPTEPQGGAFDRTMLAGPSPVELPAKTVEAPFQMPMAPAPTVPAQSAPYAAPAPQGSGTVPSPAVQYPGTAPNMQPYAGQSDHGAPAGFTPQGWQAPPGQHVPGMAAFNQQPISSGTPGNTAQRGRMLLFVGIGAVVLILGGILFWWLVRAMLEAMRTTGG